MTTSQTTRPSARPGKTAKAFTLVELMVVMFIMAVVAALVVGVSWYVIEEGRKAETKAKMARLIEAINAYRKVTGKVPEIYYDPSYNNRDSSRQYNEQKCIQALLDVLKGNEPRTTGSGGGQGPNEGSEEYKATKPWLGEDEGSSLTVDAYGKPMIYLMNGGHGGGPLIVSAGPDGYFGDTGVESQKRDNIYSNQ